MKKIGIIGGMGPAATIDLLQKIYSHDKVANEQQHLQVLVNFDPSVLDRSWAVRNGETAQLLAHLSNNAIALAAQGASLLAIACNTAHVVLPDLQKNVNVPFVDMVEETVNFSLTKSRGGIGILATDGTLEAGLYTLRLVAAGRQVVLPNPAEQQQLMDTIYRVKEGFLEGRDRVLKIKESLHSRGAELVIAACTELPLLTPNEHALVDANDILARVLVNRARGT